MGISSLVSTNNPQPQNSSAASSLFTSADFQNAQKTMTGWSVFTKKIDGFDHYCAFRPMKDAEAIKLHTFFNKRNGNTEAFQIFPYKSYYGPENGQYIFTFQCDTNHEFTNLTGLDHGDRTTNAFNYFNVSLNWLSKYSTACGESYENLNCICEDNIYICKRVNEPDLFRLLPLPAMYPGDYPGVPADAIESKNNDVRADLYSAAYMYISLCYDGKNNFCGEAYPETDIIKRCLMPFPSLRRSLNELKADLEALKKAAELPEPIANPVEPVIKDEPVAKDDQSIFDTLFGSLVNLFSKKTRKPKKRKRSPFDTTTSSDNNGDDADDKNKYRTQ